MLPLEGLRIRDVEGGIFSSRHLFALFNPEQRYSIDHSMGLLECAFKCNASWLAGLLNGSAWSALLIILASYYHILHDQFLVVLQDLLFFFCIFSLISLLDRVWKDWSINDLAKFVLSLWFWGNIMRDVLFEALWCKRCSQQIKKKTQLEIEVADD